MSTATERLQQTIQVLRSKLAEERKVYHVSRERLEVYYPNEWKLVAEAIKTVALYWHGEIVRAKHDLADWMNGHEVRGTYGGLESVTELHEIVLKDLPDLLDAAGKAKERYNSQQIDPLDAGASKGEYESAIGELKAAVDLIQSLAKDIEEKCYAER